MMRRSTLIAAAALGLSTSFSVWSAGDAEQGEELFHRMCTGCHALDSEKVGPRLRGVFGRTAGAVKSFPYSEGMKKARVVWDEATLDKWLTDPSSVVADNDMAFRSDSPDQRAAIIAYLKRLARK